jgi:hypothetical protein
MDVRLPNDRDGLFMCGASVPVSEDSDRWLTSDIAGLVASVDLDDDFR